MTYPYLREGDHLPMVGVMQKLLRRQGSRIAADGIFGPRTAAAVREFQRQHHLAVDGIVGRQTWPRLVARERDVPVLDCIDVFDPSLMELEAQDIGTTGGRMVLVGGMCNGVEQAVRDICRAADQGHVALLRFHGHGGPGWAGISAGHGEDSTPINRSAFEVDNLKQTRQIIRRLRPIFGPYGCIQFMHCSSGRGLDGTRLLKAVAEEALVPATAAVRDQLGGGLTTFRFEGQTKTVFPSGQTLATWSAGLPELAGMSVA